MEFTVPDLYPMKNLKNKVIKITTYMHQFIKRGSWKGHISPWLGALAGWNVVMHTRGLWVWSLLRAHTQAAGCRLISSQGAYRGQPTDVFLSYQCVCVCVSLSLLLPSSHSLKKKLIHISSREDFKNACLSNSIKKNEFL